MSDTTVPNRNLERALWLLAFLFFALRYLWPGDTVYILDEAFLQLRLDEHFAAGTIPLSNSRGSSIPLPYGPGGLWFYMVLRLFTWRPEFMVFAHVTLNLAGVALALRAFRRAYGPEAAAWCALLIASSPLLFFFSRHAWDNTLLIPIGGVILWLLQKLREGSGEWPLHALLGLVTGYGVNIHLMFGPVAVAVALTLLLFNLRRHGWRAARAWGLLALFGLCATLVLAPYLWEAWRIVRQEEPFEHARNKEHWGDGRNLWWIFLRTTLFSSPFKARAQLDEVRDQFFLFTGPLAAFFFKVDLFGWPGKLAAWGPPLAPQLGLARGRVTDDPLRLLAALAFVLVLLVDQYLNIPMAPHYFNPIWWFVFVGIACSIPRLHALGRRLFLSALAALVAVNGAWIVLGMLYMHVNKGARTMETSVAVHEQMRNLRELCAWGQAHGRNPVRVFKDAFLGEPAFDFLPRHMPECQGTSIELVSDTTRADFIVHHPRDSATSAALVADPVIKP